MYKASAYDPRLDRFVDQFEETGDGYLYRRHQTGPAYRVTVDEEAALVAAFGRRRRWVKWVGIAILIGCCVVLFARPSLYDRIGGALGGNWMLPLFWAVILAMQGGEYLVASHVPLALLRDRMPVAPALSPAERRRLALELVPDTVLIGTVTATVLVLLFFAVERPSIGAVGWTVIAAGGVALSWALVLGARRWRLGRADYAANNLI